MQNQWSGKLPQGGISGQAMPTPASKPQTPEMMKAGEEMRSKAIANGRREHAEMMEAHKKGAGSSGQNFAPDEKMKKYFANMTPEQKFALSSTSVRTPVGASRPPAQANPVQAPQAAVQSAPRPDLSGGPRQPMGRPRQPMSGPSQPMGAPRQPMGRPTGGPGQLPPNKGRRRPSTGPGMGRARRATGLARRARRATGLARRVRRSRG
jgi:hypothetical protein